MADDADSAQLNLLPVVLTILNLKDLLHAPNAEVVAKLKMILEKLVPEVHLVVLHVLEEDIVAHFVLEDVEKRPIKHVLNNLVLISAHGAMRHRLRSWLLHFLGREFVHDRLVIWRLLESKLL